VESAVVWDQAVGSETKVPLVYGTPFAHAAQMLTEVDGSDTGPMGSSEVRQQSRTRKSACDR
jgi:hypothetical protein